VPWIVFVGLPFVNSIVNLVAPKKNKGN
jgi:hypothetical protein